MAQPPFRLHTLRNATCIYQEADPRGFVDRSGPLSTAARSPTTADSTRAEAHIGVRGALSVYVTNFIFYSLLT